MANKALIDLSPALPYGPTLAHSPAHSVLCAPALLASSNTKKLCFLLLQNTVHALPWAWSILPSPPLSSFSLLLILT